MSAQSTQTQSYLVRSVDDAIARALRDLGPDAFLLNSRRVTGENGQPDGYEVVFGTTEPGTPVADVAPVPLPAIPRIVAEPPHVREVMPEAAVVSPGVAGMSVSVTDEMAKLHAQIDEIRGLLMRSSAARASAGKSVPELADVYARLIQSEVDQELSKDIVDRLEADMATDAFCQRPAGRQPAMNRWKSPRLDPARLEAFLRAEMDRRVTVDSRLGTVAAFVGPTGAGKTTSIMKLAASEITDGRPLRLLSLDTPKAAGSMLLRSFATTLKIPFTLVPSADALPGMVAEAEQDEFVLIDTPGYLGPNGNGVQVAAQALALCPKLDVHLVIPAYMKANDLRVCIQKYGVFQPKKVVVTKLDETQAFGSAFSEASKAGLALSFLSHGPDIPDHLRRASIEDLLALALDRRKTRAQVA